MVGVGPAAMDQLGLGVVPCGAECDVQRVEMLRCWVRHLGVGRLLIVAVHIIVPAHPKMDENTNNNRQEQDRSRQMALQLSSLLAWGLLLQVIQLCSNRG